MNLSQINICKTKEYVPVSVFTGLYAAFPSVSMFVRQTARWQNGHPRICKSLMKTLHGVTDQKKSMDSKKCLTWGVRHKVGYRDAIHPNNYHSNY